MSERFPGGIISKTAPVPTGPYETGTAPGIWTLDQQAEFVKQGIWPIAGLTPNYIEDVFSTYLYTGTGSTQTITNGIDLAGEGGMVWTKCRNAAYDNWVFDTVRGAEKLLITNSTTASGNTSGALEQFNADGYQLGYSGGGYAELNESEKTYASWTFRKQPKFFDVITWTGTGGTGDRAIAHSLASVPAAYTIKPLTFTDNWQFRHKDLPTDTNVFLNLTNAATSSGNRYGSVPNTSSTFYVNAAGAYNINGETYVAYLFAHNAGGFGLSGTDNVISCGSYTGNGSSDGPTVTLGYEPQWLMVKCSSDPYSWIIVDNMRGMDQTGSPRLFPNTSDAESAMSPGVVPTATGFKINTTNATVNDGAGVTYIYIAIRRGPMKVPTDGTEVFKPLSRGAQSIPQLLNIGFPTDLAIGKETSVNGGWVWADRLRGANYLQSNNTNAEGVGPIYLFDQQNYLSSVWATSAETDYAMRRAPGFFDEVCYTGTGVARTVAHNLTVAPELVIIKQRNAATDWWVINYPLNGVLQLNNPYPINSPIPTNLSTGATATTFSLGTYSEVNGSGSTYVAYLFATCAGVSKVGSYTGTGTTQTINCGFTAGARFVMIKRADDTGLYTEGWYVWDSARGIVAGNDPYLLLNSTAAEVTSTDYVDTYSAGFEITSTAPAAINASGGSFIFLAIS